MFILTAVKHFPWSVPDPSDPRQLKKNQAPAGPASDDCRIQKPQAVLPLKIGATEMVACIRFVSTLSPLPG